MAKFIEMTAKVLTQSAGEMGDKPTAEKKTGDDSNTKKGRESDGS